MSPEMNLVIANQNIWIMSFLKSEHESKQSQAGWDACESQNLLLLNRHSARTANRQVQMNDWFALAFSSLQEPLMSAITSHCVLQITDLCQIEKFKKSGACCESFHPNCGASSEFSVKLHSKAHRQKYWARRDKLQTFLNVLILLSRCTQQGETRNTQTRRYFKIIVFNDDIKVRQGKVDWQKHRE